MATITVAKPQMKPLLLHALTVLGNVASVAPAANTPEPLLIVPPPATAAHTTGAGVMETTAPVMSVPTAANCWDPLGGSVAGLGVTVMDSN